MAKKKKLVDQDFNQNEIQNAVDQNLATAPSNPKEGQFYWDTANKADMIYDGIQWVSRTSQGKIYTGGTGIDVNGTTISVDTTIASKTDIGNGVLTIQRNGSSVGSFTANQTSASTINISVPTTATDVGALPSDTVIGDGKIIYQKNGTAFATASANQTSTVTVNYTIPTQASDINAVPTSRTINGHTLTADVTLTSADVGALPSTTTIGAANTTIQRNGSAIGTINANATTASTINISVPTTASEVGALPSSTTITDLASTTQMAAINSGVTTTVVAQVGTNATDISTINGKIPTQATTSNQLADKNFVNSSVQTATANFRGNWATWADVPTVASSYPEDYAGSKTPTVNDYLVVQDASGYTGETLDGTWRFKYSGDWSTDGKSGWLPEYQVNETPLTAAQLAAINSGITAASVTQIATNTSAISGLSTSKQDKLTAGSNITISGNTISATDTTYSAGANIQINGTTISATDTTYVAGSGIAINGNTISNTQTSAVWGNITGTLSNQTDLNSVLASKSTVTFVDWTV